MFFHIGGGCVVRDREIVGIFDIDTCSTGQKTRNFFKINQQEGKISETAGDLPKSFVVTNRMKKDKIYISGVSPATLRKRVSRDDYAEMELE